MNQYIGKRLGSYQILEQIGQGGMATVFKAYQPSMDRYVAVKILPSYFTEDATFMARFTREARTLARLEHPHILPVHDYGEQEGITYLVMRCLDAGTLKDLIAQHGPLDLNQVAHILGQVGRALGYAHSQGIIHRDIKPSNVLIDEQGNTFLADFGIAKLVVGTTQLTATGSIVGTPAYMSPEQGMGQPLDHRCDIYALGIVLYEMVTGRVPFDAETPLAVLMQHVNAPLPPPRQFKPDLPEAVERVILKALAKLPDDRFQTAEEMVETLQKAVTGLPTEIDLPPQLVARPTAVMPQTAAESIEPPPSYKPISKTKVAAPARKPLPWLPIVGGVAVLAMVIVAALLILPNWGDGEAEATPVTTTPSAAVTASSLPSGWTSYTNGNFVYALARQGDYLWAGGSGGLVRWDLNADSYVKFGIGDGLASGQINDLLVDGDGNLWVATEAGVNRFDASAELTEVGQMWLTFDETDGLDSRWVRTLFLDNDGALWAGTVYGNRGLNYYDGTAWGPPLHPPLPIEFPKVRALAMEKNFGLWVGLEEHGLAYSDGSEWRMFNSDDGLPGDHVYDLLLTDDDELWVSFESEVVRRDPETGQWETVPQLSQSDVYIYVLHQASDDSLWFAGGGGAVRYDSGTGDWQRFATGSSTIPAWAVTDIVEDENGLWMGTDGGGVVFYDGTSWRTWATDDQLGDNKIDVILQEETGVLWFTHPGEGLSRYDPTDDSLQIFGDNEGALDWPSVPAMDSEGHLWIGGYGQLKRYDGRSWQSFTPAQLADETILGIAIGPDDVQWLWTYTGVMRHDPATDEWTTFTVADHPVFEEVTIVYVASDGTVWAGGNYGLVYYDGSGWSVPDATGDGPEKADEPNVGGIAEASDGSLWVLASGDLFHLDDGQWIRFGWPGDWIEAMAVGPDGTVWVGHENLGRFDPSSGAWQTFTPADGLVHHGVRTIHVTPEGVIWIGTEGGVSRYVPGE